MDTPVRSLCWLFFLVALTIIPSTLVIAAERDWMNNTRVALDFAVRGMWEEETSNSSGVSFAGIDSHRVFSNASGDIGTLLVQIYATSLHDVEAYPAAFNDKDDTEIIYRNVNFNYTALFDGRMNFRVGHFEVPFGLEQVINTNGTLHDYTHGRNIGVKGDWGASVNGDLERFEYEVGWTRGSGNEWDNDGDPGIYAGRIGSPRDRNFSVGLSFLDGDVQIPRTDGETRSRKRLGVDARWFWRRFELLGEFSAGEDDNSDVTNTVLEINTYSADTTWFIYSQFKRFEIELPTDTETATTLQLGIQFQPDNHWDLSAEYAHDFESIGAAPERRLLRAQLRYRFN